jgi:hypothetical protein
MLDHIASAPTTRTGTHLVDLSARPDAPVVTPREHAALDAARAGIAARLHRIAAALEPQPRQRRTATPVCR